jgi:hypothetical protein
MSLAEVIDPALSQPEGNSCDFLRRRGLCLRSRPFGPDLTRVALAIGAQRVKAVLSVATGGNTYASTQDRGRHF